MSGQRIGVLAAIIGFLGLALWSVLLESINGWLQGSIPALVPTFGTIGTTVTVYVRLVDIIIPFLTVVLAVGLGYYGCRSVEFREDYRQIIFSLAVGSSLGVGTAYTIQILDPGAFRFLLQVNATTFLLIESLLRFLVSWALPITLGGFTGAAVWSFRQGRGRSDEQPENTPQRIQY